MISQIVEPTGAQREALARADKGTACGCPREWLENQYVYVVLSPRARGLSVGVNLTADKYCNFDCAYCEVNRRLPASQFKEIQLDVLENELNATLAFVRSGLLRTLPLYGNVPQELLKLKHVTLSGDGEPTLAPQFTQIVETVTHVRASSRLQYFKIVLITNASGLHLPNVQQGLKMFTSEDEIWAKLDAGTEDYFKLVNKANVPLDEVINNILWIGRGRPVVIQSLFCEINGAEPPEEEIAEYIQRLNWLKDEGAKIPLVQIYSATRPHFHTECQHLPLKKLSKIGQMVRAGTGLKVEVY